jgi:hypothetical protein
MIWSTVLTYTYINDFLYMAILPDRELKKDALIFCAGVSITRFTPITRGLHELSSNPAIRGLQQVEHGVSSLALSKGAAPWAVHGDDCAGIKPASDTWYWLLLMNNAPGSLPERSFHSLS